MAYNSGRVYLLVGFVPDCGAGRVTRDADNVKINDTAPMEENPPISVYRVQRRTERGPTEGGSRTQTVLMTDEMGCSSVRSAMVRDQQTDDSMCRLST